MTKQLKEIEIPFGAKDSELCDWEYTIPEGMEATIVDNKIVVKKKDSGDERIRKALLNEFIHLQSKGYKFAGLEGEEIVAWIEKQGEQKPADKVAPKFKVGDWVVYNRNDHSREVIQIYDIRDNRYYFNDNIHFSWSVKECDEKSHLWTIQDAKDGDVIVNGSNIFIFHFINDTRLMGYCHVNTDDGRFYDDIGKNECFCLIDAIVHPATKEQRDLLFQKMKEVGYEWDAEKKELKKIKGATAWSERDDSNLERAIWYVENPAPMVVKDFMLVEWLKSLKEKVQPQFTWRPSEHELEVLKLVAEKDGTCLMVLYKQLKKLKEE